MADGGEMDMCVLECGPGMHFVAVILSGQLIVLLALSSSLTTTTDGKITWPICFFFLSSQL